MSRRKLIIGRGAQPPRKQRQPVAGLPAFNWDQAAAIRKGEIKGCLISATGLPPRPNTVRALRRRFRELDGDGNPTGRTLTETTATVLTVLSVSDPLYLGQLLQDHADICGQKTPRDLERAWFAQHPKTERVRLVTFACGDTRDRAPLLAYTAGATLNPSRSPDPSAPLVPADAMVMIQNQAAIQHNARKRQAAAERTTAEDVAEIELRAKDGDREAQRALFVINQRVAKLRRGESREAA